ncbi:MAG TPA: glycoside hydrolase family 9 protein [bacterium]|nr:glycoside hydrolase family 9 protein [bacterium]HPN45547.1 glycoside hydrolase family 9 protein [bacterium]
MKKVLLICFVLFVINQIPCPAQDFTENIRINQIGYYQNGPKTAIIVDAVSDTFKIMTPDLQQTVYTGLLGPAAVWSYSEESVRKADFSALSDSGTFVVVVPGLGYSQDFEIKSHVHQQVAKAAIKSYYFQRTAIELTEAYAGVWKRKAGHPDTLVYVHASAATANRPVNTIISSSRGWYDAGDYNKYIVNSGISTYTILATYEYFPEYCQALKLSIPESGNAIPDILDEALWNIRWMQTMQDPFDGGVYHKCTSENFCGFVMPDKDKSKRWVVQKSTPAALDFAAVMAQSARIFTEFEAEMPGFADSCLTAAIAAWNWAQANPAVRYRQSDVNTLYDPDIVTGEYGDSNFADENDWAAMELYVTTGQDSFLQNLDVFAANVRVPSWPNVRTLGYCTLARYAIQPLSPFPEAVTALQKIIELAHSLRETWYTSAYNVVMGVTASDFVWGSNAITANQAMVLLQAFIATQDSSYLHAAIANLDYLLGRNATGYSFVTGYGDKTSMKIHHRQSGADGVKDPVPGFLVGGPNPSQQDGVVYPSNLPAKSFVDNQNSYASNEICINWNAPLVFLVYGMEAIMSPDGKPDLTAIAEKNNEAAPVDFQLAQNYPNPFNPETTITMAMNKAGQYRLEIYNTLGQKIITLLDEYSTPGSRTVTWNGHNAAGHIVPSGIYYYKLSSGRQQQYKKMLLLH